MTCRLIIYSGEEGETKMINILSLITTIAVYSRIAELGHAAAAVICGIIAGILAQWAFTVIKKSAEGGASDGQSSI